MSTILIKPSTPQELQLVLLILSHLKIQNEVVESTEKKSVILTSKK